MPTCRRPRRFGATLFFDQRLSRDGTVSCSTCHKIDRQFQDDLPHGRRRRPHQPAHHAAGRRRARPLVLLGRPPRQPVGAGAGAAGRPARAWPATAPPTRISSRRASASAMSASSGRCPIFPACRPNASPLGHRCRKGGLDGDERGAARRRQPRLRQYRQGASPPSSARSCPQQTRFDRFADGAGQRAPSRRRCRVFATRKSLGLKLFIGKANCVDLPQRPALHRRSFPQHRRAAGRRTCRRIAAGSTAVAQVAADPFNCFGALSRRRRRRLRRTALHGQGRRRN